MDAAQPSNARGVLLAVSSSLCIGASFVVKKRGLRLAGASGVRASAGGLSYLRQPLWWAGLATMTVGEAANFAAYAFAPAAVVTPLGALSILVSSLLAHALLGERLPPLAWLGCCLCILGAVPLVLHAPADLPLASLGHVARLAARPPFVLYCLTLLGVVGWLVRKVEPRSGNSPLVPLLICSLVGSLSVLSCKALGTSVRLWLAGRAALVSGATASLGLLVALCVTTQMLYLNKALDAWPTGVVTPLYYALFTSATLAASAMLFGDSSKLSFEGGATTGCAFGTMLCGVALLHAEQLAEHAAKAGGSAAMLIGPGIAPRRGRAGGGGAAGADDEEEGAA